jgi:hypothetical protein
LSFLSGFGKSDKYTAPGNYRFKLKCGPYERRFIKSSFLLGFGKSDKYTAPGNYSHELHTLTLKLLIDELAIHDITLICQE